MRLPYYSLLLLLSTRLVHGWKQCPDEGGGGTCPDFASCCPTGTPGVSACVSQAKGDPENAADCCGMGDNGVITGCPYGFTCATKPSNATATTEYCKLNPDDHDPEKTTDTPRYVLCQVPDQDRELHGFPMEDPESGSSQFVAPYYSNMGDITRASTAHLKVKQVVIIVHGSRRNADDYFCAGLSLLRETHAKDKVLVVAPFYPAPEDGDVLPNALIWDDYDPDTISHTWRFGADARNANVSSYAVLDAIVEHLAKEIVQFPRLERISVAGHSAGGQTTHRWALLSNSLMWESSSRVELRAVVANPRSYCYLDERRMYDGQLELPSRDEIDACPGYNRWQWGLEEGTDVCPCPYRDRALEQTPYEHLVHRYATRPVYYLSGEQDTQELNDMCFTNSFQGKTRRERAKNYVASLQEYFGHSIHDLKFVKGSPHDHNLMFQSPEGMRAIFGEVLPPIPGAF